MKRTLRKPDGTEEVLEGTAEELADHEKKLNDPNGQPAPPPVTEAPTKPGVLHGHSGQVDGRELTPAEADWVRTMRNLGADPNTFRFIPQPFVNPIPQWPAPDPQPWHPGIFPNEPYWYTVRWTGDNTCIPGDVTIPSPFLLSDKASS